MSFYSIGTRVFDDLAGAIVLPTPHHSTEYRPGQDGLTVHAIGRRGREFELVSSVYTNSWADAAVILSTYHSDPSLSPVNIVRRTETYAASAVRFIVLGVDPEPTEPAVSWDGIRLVLGVPTRVFLTPAFRVRARWRMVAIDTSLPIGYTPPVP
jgi:hypothetical protein